ncbi:MAG: hypothetical protein U5L72_09905 [Bacteroidales bacterium]|nr:hypothetical protein [Bacteroidales bacterium]
MPGFKTGCSFLSDEVFFRHVIMKYAIEERLNLIFGYIPEYQIVLPWQMHTDHWIFRMSRFVAARLHHHVREILISLR